MCACVCLSVSEMAMFLYIKLVTTVAAHLHKAEHIYCMYSQMKLQLGEPGTGTVQGEKHVRKVEMEVKHFVSLFLDVYSEGRVYGCVPT